MIGAVITAVAALLLCAAGAPGIAAGLVVVYFAYRIWRHHGEASVREAEEARLEAEERALAEEDRRMLRAIQEANERRQADSPESRIDPAEGAKAIRRMISGKEG